ncbi:MAG: NADH-quinone oxidoreductase subunit M, partial [Deltaproteobacteria bacterium]|nr:NADH-quinone oxidoreductase subunit M [Deltaproteobacteria bacterium]
MANLPILSLIVFAPLIGALMIALLPGQPLQIPRRAAFTFSLIPLALSLVMLGMFDPSVGELQLTEKVSWIPSLGVYYSLGVDGFSVWLIVLTTFLTPSII